MLSAVLRPRVQNVLMVLGGVAVSGCGSALTITLSCYERHATIKGERKVAIAKRANMGPQLGAAWVRSSPSELNQDPAHAGPRGSNAEARRGCCAARRVSLQ